MYDHHSENEERLRIQSAHLFCCILSLVSGVQCDFEKLPHAVVRQTFHVVSAEIAVSMTVPIGNPADCEVRGVIRFLQADEILSYVFEGEALAGSCSVARQCASAYCPADSLAA